MFSQSDIDAAMALAAKAKPKSEAERKFTDKTMASFYDEQNNTRLARAKGRSVMLATPVARDPSVQFTISMLGTAAVFNTLGIRYGIEFLVGSSNLPRARNGLVARFLASNFDDLIMIDDDMGWDPNAIIRLLASDKPFVGAAGRKRSAKPNTDPNVWCVQFLQDGTGVQIDEMGALKVARVGGAFMKFERKVFVDLIGEHPEWKRPGHDDMNPVQRANYHQFFRFDTEQDLEEVGEDYLFCDRWRNIGGEVWVDPSINLKHCGSFEFTGALIEILKPEPVKAVPLAAE